MNTSTILLIEDDAVLRNIIAQNLAMRGHTVHEAHDGQEALACLRSCRVDLVLLDINLPDRTGWEVLRVAREEQLVHPQRWSGRGTFFPVVVVSAVQVSRWRLAEFCPLAYLPKPFPLEALLRIVTETAHMTYQEGENIHGESSHLISIGKCAI